VGVEGVAVLGQQPHVAAAISVGAHPDLDSQGDMVDAELAGQALSCAGMPGERSVVVADQACRRRPR
jgi:hypothetical protein